MLMSTQLLQFALQIHNCQTEVIMGRGEKLQFM